MEPVSPIPTDEACSEHEAEVNDWIRFGMRLGVSAALHPLEYSKVLIQMGYEPIAAKPGRSLLGKQVLTLPNIFQYASYIRRSEGFFGMYRGLSPKLVGAVVGMVCSEKIADKLGLSADVLDRPSSTVSDHKDECFEEELYIEFRTSLKRDLVLSISGVILSHPFHVLSVRMMAQFIGKETLYNSMKGAVAEILKTEGVTGFFAGLTPKLLGDIACLILTSSAVYVASKYAIKDKLCRTYFAGCTQFVFASLLYPLQVVSTCMIVTGSRLKAGQLPLMPSYYNWLDCYSDLQARNELKRGSSLFWRYVASSPKKAYPHAPDFLKM